MNQLEITKEIVIAAIQKGILTIDETYENDEQWAAINEKKAKEIGKFFKIIAQSVNEANGKNFSFE